MTGQCSGCSREGELATIKETLKELATWRKSVIRMAIGNLATVIGFIITTAWGASAISTKVDLIREDLAKYEQRVGENTSEIKRIDRELTRHVVKVETVLDGLTNTRPMVR